MLHSLTETERNASLQRDPSSPLTATAGYSWRCAGVARGGAPRSGAPPAPGAPARPTAPLPCGWLRCRTPTDLPRAYFVGLLAYKKNNNNKKTKTEMLGAIIHQQQENKSLLDLLLSQIPTLITQNPTASHWFYP